MSWDQVQNFFVVLLAICGGISVIGGAVNLLRSWKKESRLNTHSEILQDHEKRISTLETDTQDQDKFTKVLCNSVLALVSHEINGNSIDKLTDAQEELKDYLINK